MAYQIEIQFQGKYQIDSETLIENPLVIGASANDDLINTVSVGVYFTSPSYYLCRQIGSFTYTADWSNADVVALIESFMASCKQ
jgi:hypothetical protein